MQKHIDISGAIHFGWTKFKEEWKFLLFSMALIYCVNGGLRYIADVSFKDIEPTSSVFSLLASLLTIWLYFNVVRALLSMVDSGNPQISDLFTYDPKVWTYLVASILYGLMVGIGFLLFIVPGIYFSLRYGMYLYAIADKKLGPIEALKESARLTEGVKWQLFLFDIVSVGLVITGLILLIVGIFVALPVLALATVFIYRELTNQTTEPVPVDIVEPEVKLVETSLN